MQRMTASLSLRPEIMMTGVSPPPLVRLQLLQNLDAVHVGHQQVEQNEVERLRLDRCEGGRTGLGDDDGVAVLEQPAAEQVAVAVVVVDDEDAPGLARPSARARGAAS